MKGVFRVGDTVYCFMNGKGVVVEIKEGSYSVGVRFEGNKSLDWFTLEGRFRVYHENVSLSFKPWEVKKLVRYKFRAEQGGKYYYITCSGKVKLETEERHTFDNKNRKVGNYFETELQAISSNIYKAFHEED